MSYRGDFPLESTLDFKFTTVDANGLPITLAGTPAISAYVGNGATELTAGITLSVDFDGRTGLHNVRVVATAANGYANQTQVSLVITAGTVDGDSVVGYEVASFSLGMLTALTAAAIATAVRSEIADELGEITAIITLLTTAMPDSIPAVGTAPNPVQALLMTVQLLLERSRSADVVTIKKPDQVTTLFTQTLDDGANPNSVTRAT